MIELTKVYATEKGLMVLPIGRKRPVLLTGVLIGSFDGEVVDGTPGMDPTHIAFISHDGNAYDPEPLIQFTRRQR